MNPPFKNDLEVATKVVTQSKEQANFLKLSSQSPDGPPQKMSYDL